MNILYTCDDNYVWLMGISVISLFENNQNINEITVYLLGEKVKDKNKQILCAIFASGLPWSDGIILWVHTYPIFQILC